MPLDGVAPEVIDSTAACFVRYTVASARTKIVYTGLSASIDVVCLDELRYARASRNARNYCNVGPVLPKRQENHRKMPGPYSIYG
jgi:hypothetical protein